MSDTDPKRRPTPVRLDYATPSEPISTGRVFAKTAAVVTALIGLAVAAYALLASLLALFADSRVPPGAWVLILMIWLIAAAFLSASLRLNKLAKPPEPPAD
jgi:hypothetical protein